MTGRIWRRLRGTRQTPSRVAAAVALGLFIGCLPVYGLHFVLCLLACLPFGLDLVLAYLVANVSNPLFAPFLVTLEVEVGSLVTRGRHAAFTLARARQAGFFGFVWEAMVGSVVVGGVLSALGFGIAFVVARRAKHHSPNPLLAAEVEDDARLEAAVTQTLARYHGAARSDRFSVAGKLRWDPLTKRLHALPGDFGAVLDAGAGRGQFGLLLLALGRCQSLLGFDADPRKVAVARTAAAGSARFETRDLLDLPESAVDTLLLFDVLHYLTPAEQDLLLARASERVRGRILIRELDATPGARSAITRLSEWLAKVFDWHRGRAGRHYRAAAELNTVLTAHGFSCVVQSASEGTPFGNVLIVATRRSSALKSATSAG